MLCKICNSNVNKIFSHKVLDKYSADYYYCFNCGFLSISPVTWLTEAYKDPINLSDTGYLSRNITLGRRAFLLWLWLYGRKFNYLDYAGGYGVLTRLMRDWGLNYFWDDKYTNNVFSLGFEHNHQKIRAITCFECFEHLDKPLEELDKILAILRNVLFSTELINDKKIPDISWAYYGFSHGQHIAFYSLKTLKYLAAKNNLYLYSNGASLHFFSEQKINPYIFLFILKLGILPWDILAHLFLKSKTLEDSQKVSIN